MTTRRVKDPGETITVTFRFAKRARAVSDPEVAVSLLDGTDANPAAMVAGAAVVDPSDPTQVLQQIQGGVSGCTYGIKAFATTDKGDRPACAGTLLVRTLPEFP